MVKKNLTRSAGDRSGYIPKVQTKKAQANRATKVTRTTQSARAVLAPPGIPTVSADQRPEAVIRILKSEYPDAKCSLNFETPFQLLVAVMLSAQCTDARVNLVTPELFRRFPDAHAMAKAKIEEIEELVRTTGFFRSKAKSILETSQVLVKDYNGKVPNLLDELVKLRGVGRKTANVVLGVAFGIPGLVVDTHVTRLNNRLGFVKTTDAVKIEQELMKKVPKKDWTVYAHLMIDHGRKVCIARRPRCNQCVIESLCPKIAVTT